MPSPFNKDRDAFFRNEANNRSRQRSRKPSATARVDFGRRDDVGHALYDAAVGLLEVMIDYTKIAEDRGRRMWTVEPYSYRYRYLTHGGTTAPTYSKVFFGYDVVDDSIKMFKYTNIHNVTLTQITFTPRWEVQIQYATLSEGYGGTGVVSTTR